MHACVSAAALLAVRRASTLVVLAHLYETLVYRSLGSLGLGDLLWVGHGGNYFGDPLHPHLLLSLFVAATRCYPVPLKSGKKTILEKGYLKVHETSSKAPQLRPGKCRES